MPTGRICALKVETFEVQTDALLAMYLYGNTKY